MTGYPPSNSCVLVRAYHAQSLAVVLAFVLKYTLIFNLQRISFAAHEAKWEEYFEIIVHSFQQQSPICAAGPC
jgi:hypothetical protein